MDISVGDSTVASVSIGQASLAVICGPCVIESRDKLMFEAEGIIKAVRKFGLGLVFKSSYDKANRTSLSSFRGVGLDEGLRFLAEVRSEFGVPIVTDVHSPVEVELVAKHVDMLQIPAFLCRQTDLLQSAAIQDLPVMIKKGQFLAPEDMRFAADKVLASGNSKVLLCERGTCFGYRDLVVDFRSLDIMRSFGFPTVFDATHSVQIIGGVTGRSGGNRRFVASLARAAVAVGVDAVFLEAHSDPDSAPSDGANMLAVSDLCPLLSDLRAIKELQTGLVT